MKAAGALPAHGLRVFAAAALLFAGHTACEPCPLFRLDVYVDNPDEALAPLIATCLTALPEPRDTCNPVCRRVLQLVADGSENSGLEECHVWQDPKSTTVLVTVVYRSKCGP